MNRYQILTLNAISSHGLHRFPSARYAVGKSCERPDAILVRSHDMHAMAIAGSVKAIGRAGAGTNNIPVAAMSQRGVPVFNAPGANANAVNELVLDDRAGAKTRFVYDQFDRGDANRQAVAPAQRRERLLACGNRLGAQRAGRGIRVELPNGACELLEAFLDGDEILGCDDRPGRCRLGGSRFRFVIGSGRNRRHPAPFRRS